jgi:hypothetical protein
VLDRPAVRQIGPDEDEPITGRGEFQISLVLAGCHFRGLGQYGYHPGVVQLPSSSIVALLMSCPPASRSVTRIDAGQTWGGDGRSNELRRRINLRLGFCPVVASP